jgi:biopolymer transport protein TolR
MAMSLGSGGGAMSEINITPLIDVMLVLLIIFMVIVPVTPTGLDALVPQPPKNPEKQQENDRTIVVQIASHGAGQPTFKINETDVSINDLENKLQGIFATRAEKVMFIKGDPDLNFAVIADVLNIGKDAGVDHIGLITPKVAAGQ